MHNFQIFGKFVKEGKASIKFKDEQVQLLISNCPPDKLSSFLKTISIKITCMKKEGRLTAQAVRRKLSSEKNPTFQMISPLNAKNAAMVEAVIKGSGKKRRAGDETPPAAKKRRTEKQPVQDKENATRQSPRVPSKTRKQLSRMLTSPKATKTGDSSSSFVLLTPPNKEKILKQVLPLNHLTTTQKFVLETIRKGQSVFYTGAAGTGKSFLTTKIIGSLPPDQTFVTASTAIAACHIGGITLHAFAGIGSGTQPLEQCIQLARRSRVKQQWMKCRYLVIDEISMVDGDFFDKLEAVARAIKGNDKPFGGIVLALCGDFLQLPPVSKDEATKKFCFQAESWNACIPKIVELKEIFRQSDQKFVKILQNLRYGRCTPEISQILKKTATNKLEVTKQGVLATKLFTHNRDVDYTNQVHLKRLEAPLEYYDATDSDTNHSKMISSLCPSAPSKIELCVGAQVMVTKNLNVSAGLVNGARGVVTGFDRRGTDKLMPRVKFVTGAEATLKPEKWPVKLGNGEVVFRYQLPLKLAWAISIHKSQGMTLDLVEMSLSRVFEAGQVYVALSRAKALDSIRITDFDPSTVRANKDVLTYYKSIGESSISSGALAPATLRF